MAARGLEFDRRRAGLAWDTDDLAVRLPGARMAGHLDSSVRFSTDELWILAHVSAWVRWFMLAASFALLLWRPDYSTMQITVALAGVGAGCALNGVFHFAVWTRRRLRWQWLLAMGVLDLAAVTLMIAIRGGLDSYYYVAYFPVLAVLAVIFTSFRFIVAITSLTILAYVLTASFAGDGIQTGLAEDKELYVRVVFLLPVVVAVNAVARYERSGRRRAQEREQALLSDRLELSQTIHDTAAQAAYSVGLGIDQAISLAGTANAELTETLRGTATFTKSAMWELRRPIDVGQIFEGDQLGPVLRAHVGTFNTITSIPTELEIEGAEPALPVEVRARLFSIAHNALTNAFRHSAATRVCVRLQFSDQTLGLTVSDDGAGLPDGYESRGHGLRNMRRDAELIGGQLLVESAGAGEGTTVTCTIEWDRI